MNQIAMQLDEKLRLLEPARAQHLEALVQKAIEQVDRNGTDALGWPQEYFQKTAGALAGEDFERPSQGELPTRGDW